jgi:hypothetical protein
VNVAPNVPPAASDPRLLRPGDRLADGREVVTTSLTAVLVADDDGTEMWVEFTTLAAPSTTAPLVTLDPNWTPGPRPDALMVESDR